MACAASIQNTDLEEHISEMSKYLERLLTDEDQHFDIECSKGSENIECKIPTFGENSISPLMYRQINILNTFQYNCHSPKITTDGTLNSVISALAAQINTSAPTFHLINPISHSRLKKWEPQKPSNRLDKLDPDLEGAMAGLGLISESNPNDVYRLFEAYEKLAFYIKAECSFKLDNEERTTPKTLSATAQTRHAVWSSFRLLNEMRDTLRGYGSIPQELHEAYKDCKHSLEDLHAAILKLEPFKYVVLEHRRGRFVSTKGRENFEPLLSALTKLIFCVMQSRLNLTIMKFALDKKTCVAEEATKEPSPPVSEEEDTVMEAPINCRPVLARRFIG